jgi:hypothetical protein
MQVGMRHESPAPASRAFTRRPAFWVAGIAWISISSNKEDWLKKREVKNVESGDSLLDPQISWAQRKNWLQTQRKNQLKQRIRAESAIVT